MSEWISVKRKPIPVGEHVLTCDEFDRITHITAAERFTTYYQRNATHWMLAPRPPRRRKTI